MYASKIQFSNNQSKQRQSSQNNPIFKILLLSILRILNLTLFIINVPVKCQDLNKTLILH